MKNAICVLLVAFAACGLAATTNTPPDMAALPARCRADSNDARYAYCAGTFAAGGAAALCPAGYIVPAAAHMASMNYSCDQDSARTGNFFVVDVPVWADPSNLATSSCSSKAGYVVGLEGCGFYSKAPDWWVAQTGNSCLGYHYAVFTGKGPEWTITGSTLSTASNTNPNNGVVCFKPGS